MCKFMQIWLFFSRSSKISDQRNRTMNQQSVLVDPAWPWERYADKIGRRSIARSVRKQLRWVNHQNHLYRSQHSGKFGRIKQDPWFHIQ